jgi:hypothetical protein
LDNRGDDPGRVASLELVVGVKMDDNVSPHGQSRLKSNPKRRRQPLMFSQTNDTINLTPLGRFNRSIRASIIDDQHFNVINPWKLTRQVGQRDRECLLLVITRNLNDQFHEEA